MLQGSVFTQGVNFSTMQENIDKLCAEGKECTYSQAVKMMMNQINKVIPGAK